MKVRYINNTIVMKGANKLQENKQKHSSHLNGPVRVKYAENDNGDNVANVIKKLSKTPKPGGMMKLVRLRKKSQPKRYRLKRCCEKSANPRHIICQPEAKQRTNLFSTSGVSECGYEILSTIQVGRVDLPLTTPYVEKGRQERAPLPPLDLELIMNSFDSFCCC